ncbi:MAG: adenylate/guanylate cyclase domain-containing protein, partial [Deltaproteobacteria bacterium]|nr:adenylate/guanylate cyclase domain-containing protein [Deltaproteobacteria bacterium]
MDSSQQQKDTKLTPTENLESSASNADELIKRVEELDDELEKRLTREIAILFTDIRGSTTFFRTHGDIAGRLMMQRHYDMLFPLIKQHEGTIVKTVGDSIMASFDDPYNAVQAAIAMQRELSNYNSNLPSEELIRIRIGVNFGRGIIEDSDVYGNVVNVASKLVSIGESDQILVSESIYEKLQLREDLAFLLLKTDHPFQNDLKLTAYSVRWQEEDPTSYFSPIEHVIRDKAFRTTIDPDWQVKAVFEDAETAIETSLEIQHILQKSVRDFHIGIHTGLTRIEEVDIHGGEEADEAREKAGINEIYVTQPTYESIKDNPFYKHSSLSARLENGTSLYKIFRKTSARGRIEEPYSIDQKDYHPECFYCSSRNHHSSSCPSKNIPFHTNSSNEIGYLSPAGIKSLFEKHFSR